MHGVQLNTESTDKRKITSLTFQCKYTINKNCMPKPPEGESTPQYNKNFIRTYAFCSVVSKLWPPDNYRKCSKFPPWVSMQTLQEIKLLGPYFAPSCLTMAFYHSFLRNLLPELLQDADMQTRINLWLTYGGAPLHFLLEGGEFLNRFLEQWTWQGGQTAWPAPSSDLKIAWTFISGDMWSLLFTPQKSVTFTTCNNKYKINLRWFVQHMEFSSKSGNYSSDVQCPTLKFKGLYLELKDWQS